MNLIKRRRGLFEVYDDVLPDPSRYRALALEQTFGSIVAGPDVFHGMALCTDPVVGEIVERLLPPGARTTLSMFRQSPEGQAEPNYVHTDAGMGDWTAVLYLTPDPPAGDGTSFWLDLTGRNAGPHLDGLSRSAEDWDRWHHVDARFNRLLVFRSDLFHSRGLVENYGCGPEARLIQIVFGRGALIA